MNCLHCQSVFEPRRVDQVYCLPKCRAAASRQRHKAVRGVPVVFRSARYLKSGRSQVILHIDPLWAQDAHVRTRGDFLELVGLGGRV